MQWFPLLEVVGGVVLFYQGLTASISMAMVLMLAWHAVMMFGHTIAHWSPRKRITSTVTSRLPLFWRRTHLPSVRALEALGYRELGVRDVRFAWSHSYERLFLCPETGSYAGLTDLWPRVRFFSELPDGTVVLSTGKQGLRWRGGPALFEQWTNGSLAQRHSAHVELVQFHRGKIPDFAHDLALGVGLAHQIDLLQAGVTLQARPVDLDRVPSSIGVRRDLHELAIALRRRPIEARGRWLWALVSGLWMLGMSIVLVARIFWPELNWAQTGWILLMAMACGLFAIPLVREMHTVTITLTQDHVHVKYRRHSRWIPMAQLRTVHVEGTQLWLNYDTEDGPYIHKVRGFGSDEELVWVVAAIEQALHDRTPEPLAQTPEVPEALNQLLQQGQRTKSTAISGST